VAEEKNSHNRAVTLTGIPADDGSFGAALEGHLCGKQSMSRERKFFAHESTYVDDPCEIGEGTKIWHFCHIMAGAKIGRRCNIGQNVVISPQVTLGDNVKVQNNVSIYTGVILEDDVFCGPSMVFTNVINPRSHIVRRDEYKPTLVKRGATLGANSTVVCGITIGRYAFLAAGAVANRDVPDYALMAGVPARQIGCICYCGVRLHGSGEVACSACGRRYIVADNKCIEAGERKQPLSAPEIDLER
jgi:UDP-2-acetamido-3-amino-2,3-dideoxy-glucuronate N-acetyltransferase